jgi:hypothetical protein
MGYWLRRSETRCWLAAWTSLAIGLSILAIVMLGSYISPGATQSRLIGIDGTAGLDDVSEQITARNVTVNNGLMTTCQNLGIANDFNVFVLGDARQSSTDVEGRMAVGGNATLSNFGVSSKLSPSNGSRDDLVVGGSLDYNTGQVNAGNANSVGTSTLTSVARPVSRCVVKQAPGQGMLRMAQQTYSTVALRSKAMISQSIFLMSTAVFYPGQMD